MLLDEAWLAQWTARLRELPGHRVLAIYLRGSHAQGTATRFSDVDFDVLVGGGPHESYPAWLVPHDGGLRHVSVSVSDVATFDAELSKPAKWAFGWPVVSPLRPLWIDPGRPDLHREELTHPEGEPLLEEAIEDLAKISGSLNHDLWVLVSAADLAREVPTLLRLANPPQVVKNRRDAWEAAMTLPVKPRDYHQDMMRCLGSGEPREIALSAHRLLAGTLPLIRPYASAFDKMGDLADALRDGRLDRYVEQLGTRAGST